MRSVKKTEWWVAGVVVCLEQGADLHMAQLLPLPLTISCFTKIQIDLPFWHRLTWIVPEKGLLNGCVCVGCPKSRQFCTQTYFSASNLTESKLNTSHTHTHTFNGPFSGTTQVSRYQKGKTNLDFTEARDSEWQ